MTQRSSPGARHPDPGAYDEDFWRAAGALPGPAPGPPRPPAPGRALDQEIRRPRDEPDGRDGGADRIGPPDHLTPHPAHGSRGRRSGERRRPRVVLATLCVLGLVLAGAAAWTWWTWDDVDRVALSGVLDDGGDATNLLLVGTDSREGIGADDPLAGALIGDQVDGERADTVMVLRLDDQGSRFLSLPRDLWLPIAGTGTSQRLNTAYAGGPERLVATVQSGLGLPVHHYLEVDLAHFGQVVDALGGVVVEFEHPASDPASGLAVPTGGPVRLDGSQALAYVRSRNYTETVDGAPRVDPTGDIGRGVRQQRFLTAVLDQVAATRNPVTMARTLSALSDGVVVDDQLAMTEVAGLGLDLRGQAPAVTELPVYPWTTDGGAAVLGLDAGADAVLADFGAGIG